METNNIISTPNIKGNVSSCTTNVSWVNGSSRDSLFFVNNTGFATNNCTGVTETFNSWSLSGFSIVLTVLFCFVLFTLFLGAMSDY